MISVSLDMPDFNTWERADLVTFAQAAYQLAVDQHEQLEEMQRRILGLQNVTRQP